MRRLSAVFVIAAPIERHQRGERFSYNLKRWPLNYEKTLAYLDELRHKAPPYGKWHVCMASAISSAAFSAMLGGNGHDFIAAFITGGLSMVLLKQLGGYRPSAFWENALSGAAIGALAIFCCEMDGECTRTNIIVGALMPFLPGVAFTNGLRDYMAGDLISGNSRIARRCFSLHPLRLAWHLAACMVSLGVEAVGINYFTRLWLCIYCYCCLRYSVSGTA